MNKEKIALYLKLVRWPNVLFLLIIQAVVRYCVFIPVLTVENQAIRYGLKKGVQMKLQLFDYEFLLIALSTCLIAAAGYVINDVEDVKIDRVNKPDRRIINNGISKDKARNLYIVLTLIGILLAFYVKQKLDGPFYLMYIPIFSSIFLYFYSTKFKQLPLIGNLVVSACAGLAIINMMAFELTALQESYKGYITVSGADQRFTQMTILSMWGLGFAFFAFLTTLAREIVKDLEDMEGDGKFGLKTLPLTLGVFGTKIIASMVMLFTVYAVFDLQERDYFMGEAEQLSKLYLYVMVMAPLLVVGFLLWRTDEKEGYHRISSYLKWIMMTGTGYGLIIYYQVQVFLNR